MSFATHRIAPLVALLVAPLVALMVALVPLACTPETPPRPDAPEGPAGAAEQTATYDPALPAVLTFAGDKGAFADSKSADAIPEASRGLVRVTLLDGPTPPPGSVWVGNFKSAAADGKVELSTVPRDAFEELALGQGLSSKVDLPPGLDPPDDIVTQHGDIIVYKTAWCGVCKKVESYLKKKGVPFQSKDIEKDPKAAAELQAKASKSGVRTGSVPVIDIKGELMVGFDRARLEQLL